MPMLADNVHIQLLRFPSGIIRGETNFPRGYANPNHPECGVIPDGAPCMAETSSLPLNVTIRPDERLHKLASLSAGTPCHAPVMSAMGKISACLERSSPPPLQRPVAR